MDVDNMAQFVLALVFGTGILITLGLVVPRLWQEYRRRMGTLEVLRAYAERGEEPPESVTRALQSVAGGEKAVDAVPPPPPTRGAHLAHALANFVMAAGLGWLVWWRLPESGEPGGMSIVALLVVIFLAARMTMRLVSAYYAPTR